jgi:hypothetical protein
MAEIKKGSIRRDQSGTSFFISDVFFNKDITVEEDVFFKGLTELQTANALYIDSSSGQLYYGPISGGAATTFMTASTDTGSFTFNIATTPLQIKGGINVQTSASSNTILINLKDRINVDQVVLTPETTGFSPLLVYTASDGLAIRVDEDGILAFGPKNSLPTEVTTGIIYVSGSGVTEAYYLGFDLPTSIDEQGESSPS